MLVPHGQIKNTAPEVVIPFYAFAALSYLAAMVLLLLHSSSLMVHYFNPYALAITHTLALGWGTMIILGASHQLFPVMIEGKLHSITLGHVSFYCAALGIPLLVLAFYITNFGFLAQLGAILINLAVLVYALNLGLSIYHSKSTNVHAVFAFSAVCWLLGTTVLGLLLLLNFTYSLLPQNSLHYLSLHAHLGIVGWFLFMVLGVGSRLIPMFLISKYDQPGLLWWIYLLTHLSLILFIALFIGEAQHYWFFLPLILMLGGLGLFAYFIFRAYGQRIRKKVDEQVKMSLLSVAMTFIPILLVVFIIFLFSSAQSQQWVNLYGFVIFLGWITAIILGMTFKTLPFIVWNKVYRNIAGRTKTPNPKDLFDQRIFRANGFCYILGFLMFGWGIAQSLAWMLNIGGFLLVANAILFTFNVFKIIFHKARSI